MLQARPRIARIAPIAGALSLAMVLGLSSVASAATPVFNYSISGSTLKASVTGNSRTGVWRIRVVAPSGERRIDFILRTGDLWWTGVAKVSRKQGNSWSIVGRRVLDGALAGGQPVSGCNAGVCWSTTNFRLPRNGDAKFGVTVTLTKSGTYRVAGATRQASEAFQFGSWQTSGSTAVAP